MIGTDRMPDLRAARIMRRWAQDPGTNLGAEMQRLVTPFPVWASALMAAWGGTWWTPSKPEPAPVLPPEGLNAAIKNALAKRSLTLSGKPSN